MLMTMILVPLDLKTHYHDLDGVMVEVEAAWLGFACQHVFRFWRSQESVNQSILARRVQVDLCQTLPEANSLQRLTLLPFR